MTAIPTALSGNRLKLEPHSTPAAGDPGLWEDPIITRATGQRVYGVLKVTDATAIMEFGLDTGQTGVISSDCIRITGDVLQVWDGGVAGPTLFVPLDGVEYPICLICGEGGGVHLYILSGGNWLAFGHWGTDTTASLYLGISNNTATVEADNFIVPKTLKLPAPESSDGFGTLPTVVDSGIGLSSTPVRVGFGGSNKAYFDGTNSYLDIYSADLNSNFNGQLGSVVFRSKTPKYGATMQYFQIRADINNNVQFLIVGGFTYLVYNANGTNSQRSKAASSTDWVTQAITWDLSGDAVKAFYNGAKEGATITGLGTWAGNLVNTGCVIGAANTTPTGAFNGFIGDVILAYGVEISEANMSNIHTALDAGTLTSANLDSYIGAGAWSWWKLDESYETSGLGHAEGVAGVIGQGGDSKTWLNQTFSTAGGAAYNAPVQGADVAVNGTFTGDSDWTKGTGWAITTVATKTAGTGSDLTAAVAPLTAATWYNLVYDVTRTAGTVTPKFGTASGVARSTDDTFTETQRANATALGFTGDAAYAGTLDDVVVKPLTLNTLFSSITESTADVYFKVDLTIQAGTQAGVVLCLDDEDSPANYIIVYCDTVNVYADKRVGGTVTADLIDAAVTYGAGYTLEGFVNDGVLRVFYNKLLVGTATISDAGVKDNVLHGRFSTYLENALDNYVCYAVGTDGEHSQLGTV